MFVARVLHWKLVNSSLRISNFTQLSSSKGSLQYGHKVFVSNHRSIHFLVNNSNSTTRWNDLKTESSVSVTWQKICHVLSVIVWFKHVDEFILM